MAAIQSGISGFWYGKKLPEKTKQKLREVNIGENNPYFGKHHSKEYRQKMTEVMIGEKHWNWKGGTSFEPYPSEFNNVLKRLVRQRDSYTCQLCGIEARAVHHIDYDKSNNVIRNLITLCGKCNTKVNYRREFWIEVFKKLVKEK